MLVLLSVLCLLPPAPREEPHEITAHGHVRTDDFYWMMNRDDPDLIPYLEAENAYTDSVMASSSVLIDTIIEELLGRIPGDESSVPWYRNGYWYWYEYLPGLDYSVNMRMEHPSGEPEVLLDENLFAADYDYFAVEMLSVSPDNRLVAWAYDTTGGHWNTTVVQEIETGDSLNIIPNTSGDFAWSADSRFFFYGTNDNTGRTENICRGLIGETRTDTVYTEEDPTFWPWVENSPDRRWILLGSASTLESEYRILSSSEPLQDFRLVHPRTEDLEYYLYASDSTLFIQTDLNGENYCVMRTSAEEPGIDHWVTVLEHDSTVLIEGVDVFSEIIAVSMRKDGLRRLFIADRDTGEGYFANLGDEPATFYTSSNFEADADSIRLVYTSLTTPWSTAAYDIGADTMRVIQARFAGDDFDPSLYVSRRLMATAADGSQVPIGIVYRDDLFREGENPLLLYGYGAYGASLDPMFSSSLLSLLNRGFVYADAHVRGGSEMGRKWYDQGRTFSKMNTFTDFISCAEFLAEEGWCDPDMIFAMGESAGGLLVGAVTNMRPDLWRGVIAGVPFVDALTTMLDPTIPLTTSEYDEWGNPSEDPEAYRYILSYSPVDNVHEAAYPTMYVFTGLNDSQVGYWEPAKWVASIRRVNTSDSPVLLRVNMGSGHGGASGRYGWLEATAEKYAFILEQAGIRE